MKTTLCLGCEDGEHHIEVTNNYEATLRHKNKYDPNTKLTLILTTEPTTIIGPSCVTCPVCHARVNILGATEVEIGTLLY
jgi:hypothetical protein